MKRVWKHKDGFQGISRVETGEERPFEEDKEHIERYKSMKQVSMCLKLRVSQNCLIYSRKEGRYRCEEIGSEEPSNLYAIF